MNTFLKSVLSFNKSEVNILRHKERKHIHLFEKLSILSKGRIELNDLLMPPSACGTFVIALDQTNP